MMIHLPGVLAAAVEVQDFCQQRKWRFCFIGGGAVQRWGEPRLTQDVDLTLLTGFGDEEMFTDEPDPIGIGAAARTQKRT